MEFKKIGVIHSPYDREGNNKPPGKGLKDVVSKIEIYDQYKDGLYGLKVGDKIQVLYWADKANRQSLLVKRHGDLKEMGVFSIRSPHRPNPILVSECDVLEIDGNILSVNYLEALDQSYLLDIKIAMRR